MELLTDLYDIDVDPVNFVVQKIPIMIAANSGNYQLMDRLIASGANLEKRHKSFTPLMIACESADFESTDEKIKFLDHYWDTVFAKSRIMCNEEKSCFLSAIQTNDHKLLDYLLTKLIPTCEGLVSAAIKSGNLAMVKKLHEIGKISICEQNILDAINECSIEIIDYMINEKKLSFANELDKLKTPIEQNNLEIVETLLKIGIPIQKSHVKIAVQKGHFKMLKLLIEFGADIRETELISEFNFDKIKENEEEITEALEYFLSCGANIDAKDCNGRSPLIKLCESDSNLLIIEKLVQFGAEITTKLPAMVASQKGCPKVLNFLIRNGADHSIVDDKGMSCYLYALESQNLDDIKLALPFCDKNSYGNIGLRPFHYISLFKSEADAVEIFDYLVGVGVKMNTFSKKYGHPMLHDKIYSKVPALAERYFEYEETVNCRLDLGLEDFTHLDSFYKNYPSKKSKWRSEKESNSNPSDQ